MSRITETTNATLREELVAPVTRIQWDPETDTGTVIWHTAMERWVNGEYAGYKPTGDILTITIDEGLEYVFDVPLPDGTVTQVPGALLFLGMKAAFDRLGPMLLARLRESENVPPPAPRDPMTPPPEITA